MSKNQNIKNALYLIVQPLLLNALSIPATAFIIRRLGPSGYGQWATAATIVSAISFLTSLGLRPQFIRAIAQNPENASELLAQQLGLRSLLALSAIALSFIASLLFHYEPTIRVCVLITSSGLLFVTIWTTFTDLLQGLQCVRHYTLANLVAGLVVTGSTILAAWHNTGPIGISTAYLAGPVVNVCLLYGIVHKRRIKVNFRFNIDKGCSILKESRAWTASAFLNTFRDRLEQLMIPKLVGFSSMGYYSAGSMPADKLQIIPDALSGAFYPAIIRESANEQKQINNIRYLITISIVSCCGASILLNMLAGPIAQILFPKSVAYCQYVIQVTAFSLPCISLNSSMGHSLFAIGKQPQVARSSIYATCVSIPISFILVLYAGLYGACWSYALRTLVPVLFLLPYFSKSFPGVLRKVSLPCIFLSAGITATLLQFTISKMNLFNTVEIGHFSTAIACISLITGTLLSYLSILFLFGVIRKEEIRQFLPRKRADGTANE